MIRESDGNADPVRDFTSTDDQYGSLLSEFEAGGGETRFADDSTIQDTSASL